MRQEQGLDVLTQNHTERLTAESLSALLLEDLKNCHCSIFGETEGEKAILLATLNILPETLNYEQYSQRIEFTVAGEILSNESPPLTYRVQGNKYCFYGRCSTILRVCGVDLYLNRSYTERVGDMAQQRFSILVKNLLKTHF